MPSLASLCVCALVFATMMAPGVVCADDEPKPDNLRALDFGHKALKLFEHGNFKAAFERFVEAERLMHSPVFVLYMAKSLRELGQLVSAKTLFERTANEMLDTQAPGVWKEAVREAALELEVIVERIPSVQVVIRGSPALPLTLTYDSQSVAVTPSELLLELDPGRRTLTLTDAKGVAVVQRIELTEGEKAKPVSFEFKLAEAKPSNGARGTVRQPRRRSKPALRAQDETPRARPGGMKWAGWTALSLGAAALTFGAAAGVVALVQTGEIKENCVDEHCLATDRDKADTARRWANLSTAGLAVGAISAGAGLTLLLWKQSNNRASISLRVAPASVSVVGGL